MVFLSLQLIFFLYMSSFTLNQEENIIIVVFAKRIMMNTWK